MERNVLLRSIHPFDLTMKKGRNFIINCGRIQWNNYWFTGPRIRTNRVMERQRERERKNVLEWIDSKQKDEIIKRWWCLHMKKMETKIDQLYLKKWHQWNAPFSIVHKYNIVWTINIELVKRMKKKNCSLRLKWQQSTHYTNS